MKFTPIVEIHSQPPELEVEHEGKKIRFSLSYYRRDMFGSKYDPFEYPNRYWSQQKKEVKEKIFHIYYRIYHSFGAFGDKHDIFENIKLLVEELYTTHPLSELTLWIKSQPDFNIPTSCPKFYVESLDRISTKEKTYTQAEYVEFAGMCLFLKMMVPVFGQYISSISSDCAPTVKELRAFKLLEYTNLFETQPMLKLTEYIDNIIPLANKNNPKNIINGINSFDYVNWVVAKLSIRGLTIFDLCGVDPYAQDQSHLLANMFSFIMHKIDPREVAGTGQDIKEKKINTGSETASQTNGQEPASLDRYKLRSSITVGSIVGFEHVLKDPYKVLHQLNPSIPKQELEITLETIKRYQSPVPAVTTSMLGWVLYPIVPARSIPYLDDNADDRLIKKCLAVAETFLYHQNMEYMGVMLTSFPTISTQEMLVTSIVSKMGLSQDLLKELDLIYPYKKKIKHRRFGITEVNSVNDSIEMVVDTLIKAVWSPTAHSDRLVKVLGYDSRMLVIPNDIRNIVGKMIINLYHLRTQRRKTSV